MTPPNIPGSMPYLDHTNPSPSEVGSSKPKGMQLGGHVSSTLSHAAEWATEAEVEAPNPWGNDDLMDVNADQDDWSEMVSYLPANPQTLSSDPRRIRDCTCAGTRGLR